MASPYFPSPNYVNRPPPTGVGGTSPYSGGVNTGPSQNPFTPQQTYPAAIQQNATDYSGLMSGYGNALNKSPFSTDVSGFPSIDLTSAYRQFSNSPLLKSNFSPVQTPGAVKPGTQNFNPVTGTQDLTELASTGGLSEQGIAALRERGISPIRSVYANAMQQMDRERALSGGYSPSFNAAQTRMARDLSSQISDTTTNVNAQIAQLVQSGRLAAAPALATLHEQEATRQADIERQNIQAQQQAEEFNVQAQQQADEFNKQALATLRGQDISAAEAATQGITSGAQAQNATALERAKLQLQQQQSQSDRELAALGGARSLYGTTPALASTFGNQALAAEQMARTPIPIRGPISYGPGNAGVGGMISPNLGLIGSNMRQNPYATFQ